MENSKRQKVNNSQVRLRLLRPLRTSIGKSLSLLFLNDHLYQIF